MKVGYLMPNGYTSTAYLDEDLDDVEVNQVLAGEDRHTEERVSVMWNGTEWVQIQAIKEGETT